MEAFNLIEISCLPKLFARNTMCTCHLHRRAWFVCTNAVMKMPAWSYGKHDCHFTIDALTLIVLTIEDIVVCRFSLNITHSWGAS